MGIRDIISELYDTHIAIIYRDYMIHISTYNPINNTSLFQKSIIVHLETRFIQTVTSSEIEEMHDTKSK